jgi:peptide deformylase
MNGIYDPRSRYVSSADIALGGGLVADWQCQLVEPSHPALYQRASVDPFSTGLDWRVTERQMLDLMHANLGVGLSANQVGSNCNMFVMHHSFLGSIGVYQPRILATSGLVDIEEGCLTWPLLYLRIRRAQNVQVQFTRTDGHTVVETWLDGLDARCFLHEYDHLQGINFIDQVSDFRLKRARAARDRRFRKLRGVITS